MTKYFIAGFTFLLLVQTSFASEKLVLWKRNYERDNFREFVELALSKTQKQYGKLDIISSDTLEQGRAFAELNEGVALNVAIAGTDLNREQTHLPIFIPLHKGILGFKICLKPSAAPHYEEINGIDDLNAARQLIGAGTHWPDRLIYEKNSIKTVHSPNYEQLFSMLEKKRFDCFLRSLNEIDEEVKKHKHLDIEVEDHLAIVYPYATIIYVSKQFPALKTRIEEGLQIAIKDGSFNALFDKHFADIIDKYNFYHRKIILLDNTQESDEAKGAINQFGIVSLE